MLKIIILIFLNFSVSNLVFSEELKDCTTFKQSGFEFIGKDYEEIIKFLGFDQFKIKLSRKRSEIFNEQMQEKKKKTNFSNIKNVHFLELILMKSSGYPIVFHCSWRFKIDTNRLDENNFECIEQKKKKDLFSLDYEGNFSFSSSFEFSESDKNYKAFKKKTLHSLFGKCKNIE
mgnify:CR=1 FL=1